MLTRFAGVFLAALALYAALYYSIEHRRNERGPWQVTFTRQTAELPAIVIRQSNLGISNVQICFSGEGPVSNAGAQTFTFSSPRAVPYEVPLGTCVFEDLTFLPGSVAFRMFSHEIELLPRVLIIDRQEHPWVPNSIIKLERATNAPPALH